MIKYTKIELAHPKSFKKITRKIFYCYLTKREQERECAKIKAFFPYIFTGRLNNLYHVEKN